MCVLKFEPTASWGRSVGFEGLFDGIKESLPVACGFVVRERRGTFFNRMICGVLDISLVGIFLVGNAVVLDVVMGMVSSVRADFAFPFSSWASRLMILVFLAVI